MAPVEAMLCGTPVLATPRGAMPEIVTDEVGRMFETDEEFVAVLRAICRLSDAENRRPTAFRSAGRLRPMSICIGAFSTGKP
ncbi:glycosyltransferase [Mesorhizobium sp. BAC0120]|uniref:glycosyltransferase n=1 Tax=Mesorhizobium sp. BAC0120 TaxID=3090670 RepID=UPI00298CDF74|nr:glycosyltransferase [Mesorhizobium sp. BAC0120]MDW6022133.1 glycosyltransferase [Mesorhizobium sp. BAC0120]